MCAKDREITYNLYGKQKIMFIIIQSNTTKVLS